MKIFVLGATGNVGRQFIDQALKRDHSIKAIIRHNVDFRKRDCLEVVEGDVLDAAFVHSALEDEDAVVSCLGIRKKDPTDPWSRLLSPEDFIVRSARVVVDAMKKKRISRIVVISSAGIGDSWETVDPEIRKVIQPSNIQKALLDLNNVAQVLESSELDTLAVRPVALVNGDPTGEFREWMVLQKHQNFQR
jgi:putative NADH-flavin reductase